MRLQIVTDAAGEPVSLADAKLFCRVDTDADDATITGLITAARRRVERDTGLALLTQTWRMVLDRWPGQKPGGLSPWWDGVKEGPISMLTGVSTIEIPKRPYQSCDWIKLRDAYGAQVTVDASIYFEERSNYDGRIIKKLGQIWPVIVLSPTAAIEVQFKAGFDADPWGAVPDELLVALKQLVKHWFDQRDTIVDGRSSTVPHGYAEIVNSWRAGRV